MNSPIINTGNNPTTVYVPDHSPVFTPPVAAAAPAPYKHPTVVNTFAVIGFVALIAVSMWFAVYSTRYVPAVVNRIGGAAVFLGSVFTPAPPANLSVVPTPTASTTVPFVEASSTISHSPDSTTASVPTPVKPVTVGPGAQTSNTYAVGGTATTVASPSGPADLAVTISAIGYLTTTAADSFVAGSSVPSGNRPAVQFTVRNIGGSATGTWRFDASIPTSRSFVFHSDPQQSLAPGESIAYTLGFDQASRGANQPVTISVNPDNTVPESNRVNDSISLNLNIL